MSKRKVLLVVHCVLVAQAVVMATATASSQASIGLVLGASAVAGVANAMEMPTRQSYLADLVPPPALPNAIVLQQAAYNLTRMMGPALAGLIVAHQGMAAAFSSTALLSFVALLLVIRIRSVGATGPQPAEPFVAAFRTGSSHVLHNPVIRNTLLVVFLLNAFAMSIQVVLPIYSTQTLHAGVEGYGLLMSAMGAGALVAAAPMAVVRPRTARLIMGLALSLLAPALVLLAVSDKFVTALAAVFVVGVTTMLVYGGANVTIQTSLDPSLRGRVMGLYVAVFSGGVAFGGLLLGALSDGPGTQTALVVCGVAMALTGIWALATLTYPLRVPRGGY